MIISRQKIVAATILLLSAIVFSLTFSNAQSQVPADSITIGPGDTIEIRLPAEPDLSGEYVIDERGSFKFPLILGLDLGPFQVNGKTVAEVETLLKERLSEYYEIHHIAVDLLSLGVRPNRSVSVYGHVTTPGNYQFYESIRLLDILARAGQLTEDANPSRITIHRSDSDPITVDISDMLSGEDMSSNIPLQAGDYVIVPPTRPVRRIKVMILGMVGNPGSFFLRESDRLIDALAEAEGTTGRAAAGKVHIIRAEDGKPVIIPANVKALIDNGDLRQNIEMKDGDVVFVPQTGRIDVMKAVNDIISLNLLKNIAKDEF